MKLKYIGQNDNCVIMDMINDEGGRGISVARNEIFDCPPEIAADLMQRFNDDKNNPNFKIIEEKDLLSEEKRTVGRPRKDFDVPKNKMMEEIDLK